MRDMPNNNPPDDVGLPQPVYPCAGGEELGKYPASELFWVPAWKGWFCRKCIGTNLQFDIGPSLQEWLLRESKF